MTDPHDIARAMVALPGWDWRPGMLTDTGIRVVAVGVHNGQPFILGHVVGNVELDRYYTDPPLFAPNLTDPATLGCVLALIREAHGCALVGMQPGVRTDPGAEVEVWVHYGGTSSRCVGRGASLPAALLDGLRAVKP